LLHVSCHPVTTHKQVYCAAVLHCPSAVCFLAVSSAHPSCYSTVSTQSVLHNFRNLPRAGEIIIIIHSQGISFVE